MPAPLTAYVLADDRIYALPDRLRATLAAALALCLQAGGPIALDELAALRRRSVATVHRHLRELARQGWPLLRRQGSALWVDASDIPLATALPGRDDTADTVSGVKTDRTASAGPEEKKEEKAAAAEGRMAAAADLDSACSPAEAERELIEVGVYPQLAAELARLAWATPMLVHRCITTLRARPDVRNLPGLVVTVLRNRESATRAAQAAPEVGRASCRERVSNCV